MKINLYNKLTDDFWFIALVSFALVLNFSWVPGFFADGYLYAGLGKTAATEGHWLIPKLNDSYFQEFYHHLPFVFIWEGWFFKIFGVGFTQARIFISLFNISSILLVYNFLKEKTSREHAFISASLLLLTYPLLRFSRYPNTDLPFMFFSFCVLVCYFNAQRFPQTKRWWLLSGLFLGLAIYSKGLLAIVIPAGIFFHEAVFKKFSGLKKIWSWISLLLAGSFWGLWFLLLKTEGRADIFFNYFKHVSGAVNSGVTHYNHASDYFLYTRHLFIHTGPWIILAAFATYKFFKNKVRDELFTTFFSYFVFVFVFLSFQKVKMGYYLVTLYPPLAILAGYGVMQFPKHLPRIISGFKIFFLLAMSILLVFPLTNKSSRDQGIFRTLEISNDLFPQINEWYVVSGSYPHNDVALLLGFMNKHTVKEIKFDDLIQELEKNQSCNKIVVGFKANLLPLVTEKKLRLMHTFPKDGFASFTNCP